MKLQIQKEQLLNGLQAVQGIAGGGPLPILSSVLLEADGKALSLRTTDLNVTIACAVEAKVKKPGAIAVSARRLFGVVKELAGSDISMEADEKHVCVLECNNAKFRIFGMDAVDFPPVPELEKPQSFKLSQKDIKALLRRTSFASSIEESRYVLCGVSIVVADDSTSFVATDGKRVALSVCESEGKSSGQIIVPSKAVSEATRLLNTEGDVKIGYNENYVKFSMNGGKTMPVDIYSKLIEGTFPNYKNVIPESSSEKVEMFRAEILGILKRVELMTSEKSLSIKLAFSKNQLTVSANSPDAGDATESTAINYKGKEIAIALNPTYLIQALEVLDEDKVFLEFTDELSPFVVKINGPFVYVCSPMRLS